MLNTTNQIDMEGYNFDTVEQQLEKSSLEEVKMAVGMLKGVEVPGEDSIISEISKIKDRRKYSNNRFKAADK